MKKKSIVFFSLFIFVAIIYKYGNFGASQKNKADLQRSGPEQVSKGPHSNKEKLKKDTGLKNDLARSIMKLDPRELSEEEIAEFEEYYEEVENNWFSQIEALFVGEFSLKEEVIESYMDLRESYEEEKMISFQEFHDFMASKHGDQYTYNPTDDMEVFENKVADEYYEKMRALLGDDQYRRYLEVKDQFNDRLREEQDVDKLVILIEI